MPQPFAFRLVFLGSSKGSACAVALMERLLAGNPEPAREMLAHMIEWHRREEKAPWWEYFRLKSLTDEELLEERAGLAGLMFVKRTEGGTKR